MAVSSNGRHRRINLGISVNAARSATIMAMAVSMPKRIVGMKFDNTRIENPNTMVTVV